MSYFCKGLILGAIVLIISATNVTAQSLPTFPSCLNPQGTQKVQYSSGVHGVPGDLTTYTGSDSVYVLTDETLIQCLCPPNGAGIQTNWWEICDMSQSVIDQYVSEGWIYIPTGSAWGLSQCSYLAKNTAYSCVGGAGGSSSSGSSSGSSSSSSDSGSSQGVSTVSKLGDILGLASTGNIVTIFFYIALGIFFISTGIFVRSLDRHKHG